ncbi:MAG: T9SS type A sorting domain-containing protein [Bacteroidetes bacterium]|nr:T9SS type A sorting domain-containing protein [Bacteroidota bacterium]
MKTKLLIFSIIFCGTAIAQNLVPNNGFETNTGYPSAGNQLNLCVGWSNVNGVYYPSFNTGSPDYYHTNGTGGVQLPNAGYAYLNANTGNACAGFVTWNDNATDYREYISIKLNDPGLVIGKTYDVSFYLTNGTSCTYIYQTNNIGTRFSKNPLSQSGWQFINVVPQLEITSVLNIPSWQLFSFQFTADSAYHYITIGNFRTDANTTHIQFTSGSNPYGNYFIDDISVSDVTAVPDYHSQSDITISPNPFSDEAAISFNENKTFELKIFNMNGKMLRAVPIKNNDKLVRGELSSGTYLFELIDKNKIVSSGQFIIR